VTSSTGAGVSGVTVKLSGAASKSTTTDSGGNYSFTGLTSGSYTITPSKSGCTFSPASRSVTVSGSNMTGQDFAARYGSQPTAATKAATKVTSASATLNGAVNPKGVATTVFFEWGISTSFGNGTPSQSIGSGTSNVSVPAKLSGLVPGTKYYYQVVAINSNGIPAAVLCPS